MVHLLFTVRRTDQLMTVLIFSVGFSTHWRKIKFYLVPLFLTSKWSWEYWRFANLNYKRKKKNSVPEIPLNCMMLQLIKILHGAALASWDNSPLSHPSPHTPRQHPSWRKRQQCGRRVHLLKVSIKTMPNCTCITWRYPFIVLTLLSNI